MAKALNTMHISKWVTTCVCSGITVKEGQEETCPGTKQNKKEEKVKKLWKLE